MTGLELCTDNNDGTFSCELGNFILHQDALIPLHNAYDEYYEDNYYNDNYYNEQGNGSSNDDQHGDHIADGGLI